MPVFFVEAVAVWLGIFVKRQWLFDAFHCTQQWTRMDAMGRWGVNITYKYVQYIHDSMIIYHWTSVESHTDMMDSWIHLWYTPIYVHITHLLHV